jgi:hypothetical protein
MNFFTAQEWLRLEQIARGALEARLPGLRLALSLRHGDGLLLYSKPTPFTMRVLLHSDY